jgi:hypothetical protein
MADLALTVKKGEAVTFTGTHQVSATDATPVDITGWTIVVTVKSKEDGSIVFTKPATVTNGPTGKYSWSVVHADTNIRAGLRDVDAWRTDPGAERSMGQGSFTIAQDVLYGS